jgi:hypothetical protein
MVDRILLQDDALLDRGDRSAFRRDRGLVLQIGLNGPWARRPPA